MKLKFKVGTALEVVETFNDGVSIEDCYIKKFKKGQTIDVTIVVETDKYYDLKILNSNEMILGVEKSMFEIINDFQRCNHCLCVFDDNETECPQCGNNDALINNFISTKDDHVWNDGKCMACDLLVGIKAGVTTDKMEKIIIEALEKAGIRATLSTVDVVDGYI